MGHVGVVVKLVLMSPISVAKIHQRTTEKLYYRIKSTDSESYQLAEASASTFDDRIHVISLQEAAY